MKKACITIIASFSLIFIKMTMKWGVASLQLPVEYSVGGGNHWSGASHRSVPALGSLSVRPDRRARCLVRTPVLWRYHESKPNKY